MPDFVETSDQAPDEAPKVELNPFSATLHNKFLGPKETYSVIINVNLNEDQT
jgi:hypothetical protein